MTALWPCTTPRSQLLRHPLAMSGSGGGLSQSRVLKPREFMGRVTRALRSVGLFAGSAASNWDCIRGHSTELICEIDNRAQAVLSDRFPGIPLVSDIRELTSLPKADLVTAGFPCQDLSQAGRTAGIGGKQSGLVGEVFRLLAPSSPRWLLLENVPNGVKTAITPSGFIP